MGPITAETIEMTFGQANSGAAFANFCNAVVTSTSVSAALGYPVLSERPGPDGSFDGEWTIPAATSISTTFGMPGWNVFQYKARAIVGLQRNAQISGIKSTLRGAAQEIAQRTVNKGAPAHYVLFTNLQLGLETSTTTSANAVLSRYRTELETAVRDGSAADLKVTVFDAADLAAVVNSHPGLRLTYFGASVARSWDEAWAATAQYAAVPTLDLVGRQDELKQLATLLSDESVRVIQISGQMGIGKTRLALEATRHDRARTTVVDDADEFARLGLASLATTPLPRYFLLDDPASQTALHLFRTAVAHSGFKLVVTVPTREKLPRLALVDHPSVRTIHIDPLKPDEAASLLTAANQSLDHNTRDWILHRAGGVPELILAAAHHGKDLRKKTDDLKSALLGKFLERIEREVGAEGVELLVHCSVMQWIVADGTHSEIPKLLTSFGSQTSPVRAAFLLDRFVGFGVVRRRGESISVIPPLFASALAERVFSTHAAGARAFFDSLDAHG
ncbi:MAG TPA: ATP-binding protein, partial [Opitutaceae bacterium]|nr:ATP-binding protein [Opitutaceae bacterium]